MKIFINEKPADITLDTEKILGEVLQGIEQWISPAGNRIRKLSLDGRNIPVEDLGSVFDKNVKDIRRLDITVSSFRELAVEALAELKNMAVVFQNLPFEERPVITESWNNCPAAKFLASDIADIHNIATGCFAGNGCSPNDLAILLEERLREIVNPEQETASAESLVKTIAQRMEEFPLDMQTGKDQRAAETIRLFSGIGEKLFRILSVFKSEGLSLETFMISGLPARNFMDEFNKALNEISGAYKDKDTVLAGDIAEYELAPRILDFFNALKELKISTMQVLP